MGSPEATKDQILSGATKSPVKKRKKRCGAHSRRSGKPCKSWGMENGRCRMHGGTQPKTNQNAVTHGMHSKVTTPEEEMASLAITETIGDSTVYAQKMNHVVAQRAARAMYILQYGTQEEQRKLFKTINIKNRSKTSKIMVSGVEVVLPVSDETQREMALAHFTEIFDRATKSMIRADKVRHEIVSSGGGLGTDVEGFTVSIGDENEHAKLLEEEFARLSADDDT